MTQVTTAHYKLLLVAMTEDHIAGESFSTLWGKDFDEKVRRAAQGDAAAQRWLEASAAWYRIKQQYARIFEADTAMSLSA
jgi:hypothetical protein